MVIAHALAAWLLAQPVLHDGNGAPIPRRVDVIDAIALVAAETERPKWWAAVFDTWAGYESGYRDIAGGCPGTPIGTPCMRSDGARFCGLYMIECGRLPRGSSFEAQTRIALTMFRESFAACGQRYPFGLFAGGACRHYAVVDFRLAIVEREAAVPLPEAP